jgi:hypothetical protein
MAPANTLFVMAMQPGEGGVSTGTTRFWGAQVEVGSYPTPYIPTTTTAVTRAATAASVPLPNLHTTNNWCVGVTAQPGGGRTWATTGFQRILSNYQGAAVNVFDFYLNAGTSMSMLLYDSAGAQRLSSVAHGFGSTSTSHRLVGCNTGGAPSMYVDGVAVGSVSGAGTGLFSATPTPMFIGSLNGATHFDGSISNVRVYPNQTYRAGM